MALSYASCVVRVHSRHGIKTLSFDTLAMLFTFTAKKAADSLGISSRTLIRVCRSLGIRRWPYLGFRSEKNIERVRLEAIETLQRKLERERESLPTTGLHVNASSLRSASAKRLLRVKLPQLGHQLMQTAPYKTPRARASLYRPSPTCSDATTHVLDARIFEPNESRLMASPPILAAATFPISTPIHLSAPLLIPSSTQQGFHLNVQRPSPSKEADLSFIGHTLQPKQLHTFTRTMSMQDILTLHS